MVGAEAELVESRWWMEKNTTCYWALLKHASKKQGYIALPHLGSPKRSCPKAGLLRSGE